MSYSAFIITKHKKEKGVLRIWADHTREGGWEGGGTFCDLYPVSGFLVAMACLSGKPIAVFKDLEHCCKSLEKEYGIRPTIKEQ